MKLAIKQIFKVNRNKNLERQEQLEKSRKIQFN